MLRFRTGVNLFTEEMSTNLCRMAIINIELDWLFQQIQEIPGPIYAILFQCQDQGRRLTWVVFHY